MLIAELYLDDDDFDDSEPERCEIDREDGGVCLAPLMPSGRCSNPTRHAKEEGE